MKILDIITPHETLDENAFTDMMARGGKKIRDIANDVGEKADVSWLRTRKSNEIADYVEDSLKRANKDLTPSKALKAAEKELLDLDKTISLEGLTKKRFDDFAEYLATKCKEEDRLLSSQESPILTLQGFIKNEPNPQSWMNSKQLNINLFNNEYQTWLTQSTNARVKIKQEVELAPTAPTTTTPKTKEEKAREKLEQDKLANDQLEQDTRKTELTKKDKEIKNPYPKGLLRKTIRFANDVGMSLNRWDALFASAEFSRLVAQYWAQKAAVEEWAGSQSNMPDDLAKLFPPVVGGKSQEGGEAGGKKYTYSTEEDRYALAASYAVDKLWARCILQMKALGVSLFLSQGLLYAGGGTAGKASTIRRILNIVTIYKTRLRLGDILAPILRGSSKLGQMMFVDYFISVTNPNTNAENTYTAGIINALNKVPEYVNSSARIPPVPNFGYDPNIYNAWTSFSILDIWYSDQPIREFIDSGMFTHTSAGLARGVMPIDAIADTIVAGFKIIIDFIIAVIPFLKYLAGKDPLDIPVGKPKPAPQPAVAVEPSPNAAADQSSMAGDTSQGGTTSQDNDNTSQSNNNNNVPPAKQNKNSSLILTPSDSGYVRESINESLKRRVAQLMKS
jgi:hypothetical protein